MWLVPHRVVCVRALVVLVFALAFFGAGPHRFWRCPGFPALVAWYGFYLLLLVFVVRVFLCFLSAAIP